MNENDIFNIIYKYKDCILDDDLLRINNISHNIINKNNELFKINKNLSQKKTNIINDFNIINYKYRCINDDNNRLTIHNAELHRIIKQLESYHNDEKTNCNCSNEWNLSDTSTKYIFEYAEYFCLDNLKQCNNFKELCKHCPLIKNLFGQSDLSFIEDPIYKDYDPDYVKMIIKILLLFIKDFKDSYNKSIVVLVIFDFIMRNINFVINKEYKSFANIVLRKFEEFSKDKIIFIPIAESYNVNFNKWYKIIQDIILKD